MKELRIFLPIYRIIVKQFSKGYGFGKTRLGKIMLKIVARIFESDFVKIQGHDMYIHPGNDDYSLYGVYGELDTKIVKQEIKKGDIVVDVGASIGYFTLIFAQLVGNEGKVFAFEPRPERFELLKKNIEINGYQNIIAEQKAVMNHNGKDEFYFSKSEKTGFKLLVSEKDSKEIAEKIFANTIRLDDYFNERNLTDKINFIKSDVDGPEFSVLQSAESILKNKHVKIFFEWDHEYIELVGDDPEKVLGFLYKNDFKIYSPDYKNQKYTEIAKKHLLGLKSSDTVNLLCKKE